MHVKNYTENNSISSSNDENEASPSPVTGWEVALFTDQQESCDQNIVAENIEVGILFLFLASDRWDELMMMLLLLTIFEKQGEEPGVLKLDSLYDEAVAAAQHDGGYEIGQVNSNPFDYQAIHGPTQYNMALAPPNGFYVNHNIPGQLESMQPYQVSYNTPQQQQQEEEPYQMVKKSTNPFDEPNILPPPSTSSVHQHPTQAT